MSLSKAEVGLLAEALVGSARSLRELFPGNLTKDDLHQLDYLVFLCQVCGWWYDADERPDAFDVCDDCSCHV